MPLIRLVTAFLPLLLLFNSAPTLAQAIDSKGSASVSFEGKLTPAVKQQAFDKAKINALDRYIAQGDAARSRNYELVRERLISDIDTYILSAVVLSEDGTDKSGRYTVTIRAELNEPRLENALIGSSVVSNTPTGQKSLMTFVFVARQQKSVQRFDDKVYKRTDTSDSGKTSVSGKRDTTESEAISNNGISTSDRASASMEAEAQTSSTVTTGGSSTAKADVVDWDVTRADEVNSVMTGAFSGAGFEVVEAEYLDQLNLEAIRADYGKGDDLAPATLREAVKGVKAAGAFRYLALGRLDVGMRDKDPASGLTRVFVTVSGKVLDISGGFPKTVSSVGPEQFAGLGPSETVARTNALQLAASAAADRMINELNARGVQ